MVVVVVVANITTAYINDIPGTAVKKNSLASLSLTAFVNNSRGSSTYSNTQSPCTHTTLKKTIVYQSKDSFPKLLNDYPL